MVCCVVYIKKERKRRYSRNHQKSMKPRLLPLRLRGGRRSRREVGRRIGKFPKSQNATITPPFLVGSLHPSGMASHKVVGTLGPVWTMRHLIFNHVVLI